MTREELIFVTRENEILISVIRNSLFFPFVNRAWVPLVGPPLKQISGKLTAKSISKCVGLINP